MAKYTHGKKVIAVLPAYNAEKTLERTVNDIPAEYVDEIILVDDCSKDNTFELAKELGLIAIKHKKNLGYGGNQKTCYTAALKRGADIAIMIHPDHQYNPQLVPELLMPFFTQNADAVFGSRMMNKYSYKKGGMPWWKIIANKALTKIENTLLNTQLSEFHSGYRAYSRKALETIWFEKNSNKFVFDTEIIVQLILHDLKIIEVPIETRYFPEASMISFKDSSIYGCRCLKTVLEYRLLKPWLSKYHKFWASKRVAN